MKICSFLSLSVGLICCTNLCYHNIYLVVFFKKLFKNNLFFLLVDYLIYSRHVAAVWVRLAEWSPAGLVDEVLVPLAAVLPERRGGGDGGSVDDALHRL